MHPQVRKDMEKEVLRILAPAGSVADGFSRLNNRARSRMVERVWDASQRAAFWLLGPESPGSQSNQYVYNDNVAFSHILIMADSQLL